MSSSTDPLTEEHAHVNLHAVPASAREPKEAEKPEPEKPPAVEKESAAPAKEAPLVAALRCAMEQHPSEAKVLLQKYGKDDRELLLALLSLTAGVEKGELPKLTPQEVEHTLEQLCALTQHLRQRAQLALGKVCFCHKIENFGQYEPLGPDHPFQAGCDGRPGERVQIYAEVRNFGCRLRDGQYETVLASSLDFYPRSLPLRAAKDAPEHETRSQAVVTMNLDPCIDRSQTPRQDYFLNFQFHVPRGLPPGLYTLVVTVKDVTPTAPGQPRCARVAKRSMDFKVCPYSARPRP
jgi:hypothetical protein